LAQAFITSGRPGDAVKMYQHGIYVITHQLLDRQQRLTGPYIEDAQLKIAELQMNNGQKALAYPTFKRIYGSSSRAGASRFARYGMLMCYPDMFKNEVLFRTRKPSLAWLSTEEPRLDKKFPKDPLFRARTRLTYGDALASAGKNDESRRQYEKALHDVSLIQPEQAHVGWYMMVLKHLGNLAFATGNVADAERCYADAEKVGVWRGPEHCNTLAAHELAKGDVDAARKALWHEEEYQYGLCDETECAYLYWKARTELASGRRSVALDLVRRSAHDWEICAFMDPSQWVSPTYADTLKLLKELSP
jgi:hypothetical protein